jgi:CubicO group peptidase (beta-lactamase class C family)
MKRPDRLLASIAALLCAAAFSAPGIAQVEPAQVRAAVAQAGAHELTAEDAQAWLDGLFPYALDKSDLAGAVVVVVKDGGILLAKGYGYADVATKKPVDPATTLFRVGSISKTFMWTAVMQLVGEGRIDLDADVNKYLDFTIPRRDGKPITMRDLMTHTPGLEETDKNLFAPDIKHLMSNEAWVKEWIPAQVYAPGEVSAYSNYGAALAGYIVQRVSGQPFDDYIEQHIYRPLGMKYATFRQPLPAALASYMAKSYAQASSPARPFELVNASTAGSMSASGEAMARFMIAHLQDGRYNGAQILRPEIAQQMHGFTRYSVPSLLPIALGFYHLDRNGREIIGHGGDTQMFHSELMLYPKQNVGVFVSIDGADASGLRHQLEAGFADRYFPDAPAHEPTLPTAREHGAQLVGRYLSSRVSVSNFMSLLSLLSQSTIAMDKDGTLVTSGFKDLAGQPRRWREVAPFLWRDVDSGGHLGALIHNGKVRWLSIDERSPITVFMPVPGWQSAAWNLPLLCLALLVFLLAVVLWPIAALVRRAHGKPLALQQPARRWYRWSRITAIAHLLFFGGWVYVLARMNADIANMSDGFDSTLRIVQVIGVLAIIGTIAALANARYAWRTRGSWWRKLNSLALVLACFATIWFAFSLHLLNVHLNY